MMLIDMAFQSQLSGMEELEHEPVFLTVLDFMVPAIGGYERAFDLDANGQSVIDR